MNQQFACCIYSWLGFIFAWYIPTGGLSLLEQRLAWSNKHVARTFVGIRQNLIQTLWAKICKVKAWGKTIHWNWRKQKGSFGNRMSKILPRYSFWIFLLFYENKQSKNKQKVRQSLEMHYKSIRATNSWPNF